MTPPDGLDEELALERLAVETIEAEAERCYRNGRYLLWIQGRQEAARARVRVAELEQRLVFYSEEV